MMIIRGVNVFPTQIEELMLKDPALAPHYQIEITRPKNLDEMTVLVERVAACGQRRRRRRRAAARAPDQEPDRRHRRREGGGRPAASSARSARRSGSSTSGRSRRSRFVTSPRTIPSCAKVAGAASRTTELPVRALEPSRAKCPPRTRAGAAQSAPFHAASKLPAGPSAVTASTIPPVVIEDRRRQRVDPGDRLADRARHPALAHFRDQRVELRLRPPRRLPAPSPPGPSARARCDAARSSAAGYAENTRPVAVFTVDITVPARMFTWIGRRDSWM